MNDASGGSNGFKKWVYVGEKTNAPKPTPEPARAEAPNALSGSYRPPSSAETEAVVEHAGRIVAAITSGSPELVVEPFAAVPSASVPVGQTESERLLMDIDRTLARLASL